MSKTIITDNYSNITEARKAVQDKAFWRMISIVAKRAKVSETTVTNLLKVDGPITSNTVMIVSIALEEIMKLEQKEFPDLENASRKTRGLFYLCTYYLRCKSLSVKTLKYSMDLSDKSKDPFYSNAYKADLKARSTRWGVVATELHSKAKEAQKELKFKGFKKL